MTVVPGFAFAGVAAGIKPGGRLDLAVLCAERPASAAGVFTRNRVRAAPVLVSRARVGRGLARAIVASSGNANACTGENGRRDAVEMARLVAERVGAREQHVCVASTGVIGVPLPMPRVRRGIARACAELSPDGFPRFAEAILTTDRAPKTHVVRLRLGRREVVVAGCAKGAGMIAPNLATTLAFVLTDAPAEHSWLARVLREEADRTFNTVMVDGDTSTNDSVFLLASGAAGGPPVREDDRHGRRLRAAIHEVLWELAIALVKDGEGATKLVRVVVSGARTGRDAHRVARRIAGSALVKTAFFGADPNWGRIVAAAGTAGVALAPDRIDVDIGDVPVVRRGVAVPGASAQERAHRVMSGAEYEVSVQLHRGAAEACCTTCDLGHAYVSVNADYRS